MKVTERVESAGGPLGQYVQVQLPDVRADKVDLGAALTAAPQEELSQLRLFTTLRYGLERLPALDNLSGEHEEEIFARVDLVDHAGGNTRQVRGGPPLVGRKMHRAVQALPAGFEDPQYLLPGPLRYLGAQGPREFRRQRRLAQRKRQVLQADAELATTHPPRRVAGVGQRTPRGAWTDPAARAATAFMTEAYSEPYSCELLRV